ncbi:MAG: hypothetical protein K2W80_01190 [Burkholderiales bacterium]|nr:hypothetical protein [Burkholderiales bacterium]
MMGEQDMAISGNLGGGSSPSREMAFNMKLLGAHELNGNGNVGEGISIQKTRDGRRILWVAHESAPTNFTGIDVTDPRKPKVVIQTQLPHSRVRSNSLDVVGDVMCVAYQTRDLGAKPAGFELFDISKPEEPKSISFFDCSGPHSRGVHMVWFVDGQTVHISSGAEDFEPHDPRDDQIYRIIDVSNLSKPTEVGRWWAPGTKKGDKETWRTDPGGSELGRVGYRVHNTCVWPQRPDRAYLGYIDYGAVILDISDRTNPKMVSRWTHRPSFHHSLMPLFSRDLMVMSDESTVDGAKDWPMLVYMLDVKDERYPTSISTLPMPPVETFSKRGGRFGAHNVHDNVPVETSHCSDEIIYCAMFNGGVRIYDTKNPYQPQEIGYYVPAAPALSPAGAAQMNDIWVDENRLVYTVDRLAGGIYILETTF